MKARVKTFYHFIICILAITSVTFVLLDLTGAIQLNKFPYNVIDLSILILFAIDYFVRFALAQNKWQFFKSNIFDLLAIIPLNELFEFFRLSRLLRLTRLLKLTRLIRLIGLVGKFTKNVKQFLSLNGFIYMLYCAIALIFSSSTLMTFIEGGTFWDNLWWSIVTCTTVGYGDISPSTVPGRIIAVVLMIFGIGLIGMLTSTITTYFTKSLHKDSKHDFAALIAAANELDKQQLEDLTNIAKVMRNTNIQVTVHK